MSERPGPEVEVIARAPAHVAPKTMPIAASSSSACSTAALRSPVAASTRYRSQYAMNDSHRDDEGVIGYQAATVQPAITQPSAAAVLPSMRIKPSVRPVMASSLYGSVLGKFSRT